MKSIQTWKWSYLLVLLRLVDAKTQWTSMSRPPNGTKPLGWHRLSFSITWDCLGRLRCQITTGNPRAKISSCLPQVDPKIMIVYDLSMIVSKEVSIRILTQWLIKIAVYDVYTVDGIKTNDMQKTNSTSEVWTIFKPTCNGGGRGWFVVFSTLKGD